MELAGLAELGGEDDEIMGGAATFSEVLKVGDTDLDISIVWQSG